MFCNACHAIMLAHKFEDDEHGARKDLDLALKTKFWYMNYCRRRWICSDHASYPMSAAMWYETIAEYRRQLEA